MNTLQVAVDSTAQPGFDLFGLNPAAVEPTRYKNHKHLKSVPAPPKLIEPITAPTSPPPSPFDDEAEEDSGSINLEPAADESADTFLAKRMFMRMMADLSGEAVDPVPDMFGHIEDDREQRRQDALIWMYDLNPDGSAVPFEWCCNEIGFDHERVRRITGRSVREDLKRILRLLSSMVSAEHANACECALADYVNLTGWNLS